MVSTTVILMISLAAGAAWASGELEVDEVGPAAVGAQHEPDLMPPEALEEHSPDDPVVLEEPVAQPPAQPALPDPLPPGMIARAQFTRRVIDREPSDELAQLSTDFDRVFFFTEFVGLEGYTLRHRWEYGGQVIAEVPFVVGGPRWRVYSSKRLVPDWIGEWTVSVVDASGRVLERHTLEYLQPVPEAPASLAPVEGGAPIEGGEPSSP